MLMLAASWIALKLHGYASRVYLRLFPIWYIIGVYWGSLACHTKGPMVSMVGFRIHQLCMALSLQPSLLQLTSHNRSSIFIHAPGSDTSRRAKWLVHLLLA